MKTLIETYRGWDILFDTDSEAFVTHSDGRDIQEKKRSYAACKSFIDGFIKDNNEFKEQMSDYSVRDYIVYNPESHDPLLKKYEDCEKQLEEIRLRQREIKLQFTGTALSEIQKLYMA